jgi:DNA-binding transcriptional MocR family regulator
LCLTDRLSQPADGSNHLSQGWVTSNSSFAERFLRVGETNTQTPNGLGQSVLASYFDPTVGWGMGGMLRWIWSVRREYERKRDFFCDNLCVPQGDRPLARLHPAGS